MKDESLAVKYLEYLDKEIPDATFNDFFDWAEVPTELRNNFGVAAILKQAAEIKEGRHPNERY